MSDQAPTLGLLRAPSGKGQSVHSSSGRWSMEAVCVTGRFGCKNQGTSQVSVGEYFRLIKIIFPRANKSPTSARTHTACLLVMWQKCRLVLRAVKIPIRLIPLYRDQWILLPISEQRSPFHF